jgi:hypothetical protein
VNAEPIIRPQRDPGTGVTFSHFLENGLIVILSKRSLRSESLP